jgi:hypothetical protein
MIWQGERSQRPVRIAAAHRNVFSLAHKFKAEPLERSYDPRFRRIDGNLGNLNLRDGHFQHGGFVFHYFTPEGLNMELDGGAYV